MSYSSSPLASFRTLCLALVACALVTPGCAASLRERPSPVAATTPRAAPWSLEPELLLPVNRRIVFTVELVAGHPPEEDALDTLVALAGRYGERPACWAPAGQRGASPLGSAGETIVAQGTLAADASHVLVRYVGDALGGWGQSYTVRAGGRTIYVIEINQERHRRWRGLVPERHLEAQTLIHEYGHLLGLPPFDHAYYVYYPNRMGGAHCVNPDCALSKPRFKTLLYGFAHIAFGRHYLEDYCAECKRAIAAAKRVWR